MTPGNKVGMTRGVGVAGRGETVQAGGGGLQLRFNIILKLFSGERDERAHHVLTVSCLFYFSPVTS